MPIKAIIFDLDDTLYDCSNTLSAAAQVRAVDELVANGLCATSEEALSAIPALRQGSQGKINLVEALVERFGPNRDTLVRVGLDAYNQPDALSDIALFPDVEATLLALRPNYRLILVTSGVAERQRNKIAKLGLDRFFDLVLIDDIHEQLSKRERFLAAMTNYNLKPRDVLVVGDRVFSEIKIGNQLGMVTVQMRHGAYTDIAPSKEWEDPDYQINLISEVKSVIAAVDLDRPFRVVLLGGGTGMPSLLQGLRQYNCELTAIVSVTDSGRSSGKLREEFDMAPPGDIRNCLAALAAGDERLTELLQYRFAQGNLTGHTVGNLLLVALTQMSGSFGTAVQELAQLLSTAGSVLPPTLDNLHIQAELADGTTLLREDEIVGEDCADVHMRAPIKTVSLSEPATAYPAAVEAIMQADAVILGPGGLYTSVTSNLLIEGIRDAICSSNASKIYICNLVTQPGQTVGYSAADHLRVIVETLGRDVVDHIVLHDKKIPQHLAEAMAKYHSSPTVIDRGELAEFNAAITSADVLAELDEVPELWKKKNLLCHDPKKLAQCVINCIRQAVEHRKAAVS